MHVRSNRIKWHPKTEGYDVVFLCLSILDDDDDFNETLRRPRG